MCLLSEISGSKARLSADELQALQLENVRRPFWLLDTDIRLAKLFYVYPDWHPNAIFALKIYLYFKFRSA